MKTAKLQSTNNASLFISNHEQRPVHPQHVRFLISSMQRHGFFPSKPIQCYENGRGKYVVVDGHHRLEAAKEAGCTFYFVVEEKASQDAMPDVNRTRPWKSEDFVRQYALRGIADYVVLSEYVARGIPIQCAASLLSGQSAGSGNKPKTIKDGTFKVRTTEHADAFVSLIEAKRENPVFRHNAFVKALSMLLWVKEFDFGTFAKRVVDDGHKIPNCSNVEDFLAAIDEVCNFRVAMKDRKSYVLLAKQAAARRNLNGRKL
jgi:hypothetical protein